jgi:flagellar biosynthesis protein FlhF
LTLVHAKLEALGHDLQWLGAGALGTGSGLSRVLCEQIAGEVSTSGGIRLVHAPTVVALVGPTGVGKTTTVAKLAARYRREGVSVGILALDTLRPAGVQQLDAYARILDVPVVPAYTPAQAREGLDRLRDHALVLVDTPGGSPRDVDFLDELRALLGALDPHEVHLVISAVTAQAAARAVVRQFAAVQPDQVILSKVDESPALLSLLPLLTTHGLAVSYLTTSPIAPHGLLDATVATLARFLLDDEEG